MKKLSTLLIGFGKIADGYSQDSKLKKYYPYSTHSQVLLKHPDYSWDGVVELSTQALRDAKENYNIPYLAQSIDELPSKFQPDVAVITTPPKERWKLINKLPSLKAIIVEKPLALNLNEALKFRDICQERKLLVQVNLWRRADQYFQQLANGQLSILIGKTQTGFGVYGNGLINNGIHMVDFVRFLLGEIEEVQALSKNNKDLSSPFTNDINVPFTLYLKKQCQVTFQPINFDYFRENSLELWGSHGLICIGNEGLSNRRIPIHDHRAIANENELSYETPIFQTPTVGHAFYHLYNNLAESINSRSKLWSPLDSALITTNIIEKIRESEHLHGQKIKI